MDKKMPLIAAAFIVIGGGYYVTQDDSEPKEVIYLIGEEHTSIAEWQISKSRGTITCHHCNHETGPVITDDIPACVSDLDKGSGTQVTVSGGEWVSMDNEPLGHRGKVPDCARAWLLALVKQEQIDEMAELAP